jgi:hypothetical protein
MFLFELLLLLVIDDYFSRIVKFKIIQDNIIFLSKLHTNANSVILTDMHIENLQSIQSESAPARPSAYLSNF